MAALIASCGGGGMDGDPPPINDEFQPISTKLKNAVGDTIDGYAFVLVNGSGVLYQDSAGTALGLEQSTTRLLPLASASKALAAAAIMTLVDSGDLNLDLPIHNYLQPAGIAWPSDINNLKSQITTRMLLAHTSGLPGLLDNPDCVENTSFSGGLAACVSVIASDAVALTASPKSAFIYGGADYQVAGMVAVLLSGAGSWQAFFRDAITDRLGISSQMLYPAAENPRIAGGAFASASAYGVFLRMLLNGGSLGPAAVLSSSSVTAMVSDQLQPPATTGSISTHNSGYTPYPASIASSYPKYGLGFFIEAASRYAGSPGPEVSSQGLFGATPWIDFGLDYAAMLLLVEESSSDTAVVPASVELWNELRTFIISQLD